MCDVKTDCEILKNIPNLKKLYINKCYITEIYDLHNLEFLYITECQYLEKIYNLDKLSELTIKYCYQLNDISDLINIKELYITSCTKLFNINTLINIEKLTITHLLNIYDISNLKKLNDLTLRSFHCLNIPRSFNNIDNISIFNSIIYSCQGFSNIKFLNMVHTNWNFNIQTSNIQKLRLLQCDYPNSNILNAKNIIFT